MVVRKKVDQLGNESSVMPVIHHEAGSKLHDRLRHYLNLAEGVNNQATLSLIGFLLANISLHDDDGLYKAIIHRMRFGNGYVYLAPYLTGPDMEINGCVVWFDIRIPGLVNAHRVFVSHEFYTFCNPKEYTYIKGCSDDLTKFIAAMHHVQYKLSGYGIEESLYRASLIDIQKRYTVPRESRGKKL